MEVSVIKRIQKDYSALKAFLAVMIHSIASCLNEDVL